MPLNTPDSVDDVIDRAIADVDLALSEFGAKPSLSNSYIKAIIVAYSNRVFDEYFALDQAALEAMPDTAEDNALRWGAIYGLTRNPGRVSSGTINATGTVGKTVPLSTVFVSGDGFEYVTIDADVDVAAISEPVSSIARVGSIATVTTTAAHGLSDNVPVTIVGATETDYNVSAATISVTGLDTFTYAVANAPSTPASGSPITADHSTAILSVESLAFSADANRDGLAGLELQGSLDGVDDTAGVTFDGLTGGTLIESLTDFKERYLDKIRNPVAHFNVADIVFTAKKVSGVTRVFVFEITPEVGQVTVYFMRDDDDSGAIPDGTEVAVVKAALDLIRPANTAPADLIVLAPTAMPTDFVFTAINPDTASMKTALRANLTQFFKETPNIAEDVISDAYRSIIYNTVDTSSGVRLSSFTLSTPAGDIVIGSGEIATLGSVTF